MDIIEIILIYKNFIISANRYNYRVYERICGLVTRVT